MQHSFKNTFPLDRKIKVSDARESANGIKIPLAGIRLFFKNYFSPMASNSRKKSLNKRMLEQKIGSHYRCNRK